jgi:hypothetical protein
VELGESDAVGSRDQDEDPRSESDRRSAEIADEVKSVDLDRMTPVEALMKLAELRDRARQS